MHLSPEMMPFEKKLNTVKQTLSRRKAEADITDIKRRPSNAFPTIEYIKRVYEALCNRFQIAEGDGEGVSAPVKLMVKFTKT